MSSRNVALCRMVDLVSLTFRRQHILSENVDDQASCSCIRLVGCDTPDRGNPVARQLLVITCHTKYRFACRCPIWKSLGSSPYQHPVLCIGRRKTAVIKCRFGFCAGARVNPDGRIEPLHHSYCNFTAERQINHRLGAIDRF